MNLIGKIVQVHLPDTLENKAKNNQQLTCPAIVTADWNPESDGENKLLNLRLVYDGPNRLDEWCTSIQHTAVVHNPDVMSWELYN